MSSTSQPDGCSAAQAKVDHKQIRIRGGDPLDGSRVAVDDLHVVSLLREKVMHQCQELLVVVDDGDARGLVKRLHAARIQSPRRCDESVMEFAPLW
jgi:hypothetical protein